MNLWSVRENYRVTYSHETVRWGAHEAMGSDRPPTDQPVPNLEPLSIVKPGHVRSRAVLARESRLW